MRFLLIMFASLFALFSPRWNRLNRNLFSPRWNRLNRNLFSPRWNRLNRKRYVADDDDLLRAMHGKEMTAPAFSETHKGLDVVCKGVRDGGILARYCEYIAAHGYEAGADAALAEIDALADEEARIEWVCGSYARYVLKGEDRDAELLAFLNGEEAVK